MATASAVDIDADTRLWIRNASDEAAAQNGCRFNVERGAEVVWWIERYCRLYEGEGAGGPLILRGCGECDYELPRVEDWDDEGIEVCLERAARYAECVAAGHWIDWQYECTMRMFGWEKWSEKWDRWIRRFRESSIWIAKKNKKSPTLAAWGLYLLCGDGEPGQKVFLAAKDGQQAREIAGKHAIEMLQQSEELMDACTINKVFAQITHEPSRSIMKPLSSSNSRTQQSKEGLNGSVLIDETHVVDGEFISRISRAGISRSEPVQAEFSTAGDNPDGYGKKRFDYALKVQSGEIEDQGLFVAVYAAPQEVTDAQLDADPLKYGRMANPALGHTVDPEEFLTDYNKSKREPSLLLDFKKYRLNVWQNASNPWLKTEHWMKGKQKFSVDDMEGRDCWAALDLSSVTDFTALCLAFPEPEECFKFLWWFWLPEETANKVRHQIDIDRWLADKRCKLMLTPGARVDYGYIRSTFRELHQRFKIHEMAYDDWNAEQTTQELEEGVRDKDGRIIEPGTGVPRVNFGQGIKTMNEPTKKFEVAVIDGRIQHNGDPLAAWMAQNATIKPDANGNYKPMKPGNHSLKKIDGIIVAVMGHARAVIAGGEELTVYDREKRGLFVL